MVTVPYGSSVLVINSPWPIDVADTPIPESPDAVLQVPHFAVEGYTQAAIVFTDATRHSPDRWFVEAMLAALPFPREKITFICALGMHRPSTPAERVAKLGADIVEAYHVIDHDPQGVITVGEIDGIPVEVNPLLADPQTFVLMTGVVEPHQYAGYSGGAKTAVIGCGGPTTIRLTHGPKMLDRQGVRMGQIEGNPFQTFVRQAGAMIGVNVVANAVMPSSDKIAYAAVGDVTVHDILVAQARALYETPVPHAPYDIVVAGVGAPKDANLYQASRAATYIGLSSHPVICKGGVIITPVTMPEGAGHGSGEQQFYAALQEYGPTETLIQHFRAHGCLAGQQRSYMIAQLLANYHLIMVGADDPTIVTGAGLRHAPTLDAAFDEAAALVMVNTQEPKVLVVPHALKTIPKPYDTSV